MYPYARDFESARSSIFGMVKNQRYRKATRVPLKREQNQRELERRRVGCKLKLWRWRLRVTH